MRFTYFVKRLLRRHIPAYVFFKLMHYSGRANVTEDNPGGILQELRDRLQVLETDLAGKHVLDFGSGRYARLALQLLHAGASRVTMADFYAAPLSDPQHRAMLEEDCVRLGLDSDDALSRIHIVTGDFLAMAPPPPEMRVDLIISTATMEHVEDPQAILNRSWRWLKPGGLTSHVIDLRDHVFETPFEMLTYSDRVWKRWLVPKGGFHLNRWRLADYLQAMERAGFMKIDYRPIQQDRGELLKSLGRFDLRFRRMDVELLSIMVVHLFAQRPADFASADVPG